MKIVQASAADIAEVGSAPAKIVGPKTGNIKVIWKIIIIRMYYVFITSYVRRCQQKILVFNN